MKYKAEAFGELDSLRFVMMKTVHIWENWKGDSKAKGT